MQLLFPVKDILTNWDANKLKKLVNYSLLNLIFCVSTVFAFNMAYVEVNSNHLENVGCFVRSDNHQPFFAMTSIFAANINGNQPNEPIIFFNENVKAVLKSAQIDNLHKKGIKVLMTVLGNHQNAGWSCMTDEKAALKFADAVVLMVNQYKLDGVDIDDEYSTCQPNDYSLIMLAQAIKSHPDFQNKILTKALFADGDYFKVKYKGHRLADYLDYGWEMGYSDDDFDERLALYLKNGMQANQLMIGGWTAHTYPDPYLIGQYTVQHSLAGTLVYDVTRFSQNYLDQIIKGQIDKQVGVEVVPDCLS